LRGFGGGGANRRRNRMEDSVKLTDIQRRLLAMSIESGRTMMRVTHLRQWDLQVIDRQ
jgi:hypothetical protein